MRKEKIRMNQKYKVKKIKTKMKMKMMRKKIKMEMMTTAKTAEVYLKEGPMDST